MNAPSSPVFSRSTAGPPGELNSARKEKTAHRYVRYDFPQAALAALEVLTTRHYVVEKHYSLTQR
jgi:hypothetical protein